MADIPYVGDSSTPNYLTYVRTWRKVLNLYRADVFDECASVLRDIIKTDPPIYWKCSYLAMLCATTEHWYRAERYRLHAEALWKLLDQNRSAHKLSYREMAELRRDLNDAFRWCWEGRPDDPEADAEGVEEYWEEWGGKDPKEDFDISDVGVAPVDTISEITSGASMATLAGSNTTITQAGSEATATRAGSETTATQVGSNITTVHNVLEELLSQQQEVACPRRRSRD
jgi:hypothetical protein